MGSSIRSYLWLRCGVFHQIPTLAGVSTLSGEWYRGSTRPMLCLHLSCLLPLSASLPVYLLCVAVDRHGNTYVYCLRVLPLCMWSLRHLCVFSVSTSLSLCSHLTSAPSVCSCTPTVLYIREHVSHDSVCACDQRRPCGRGSTGWPVDTESWQGSFLLPSLWKANKLIRASAPTPFELHSHSGSRTTAALPQRCYSYSEKRV